MDRPDREKNQQHYLRRCDWTGKYSELAGHRRRKLYVATCACGFRVEAYGRHIAECKIYGHQETMSALIPDIEECNQLCCDFIADQAKRQERERIEKLLDMVGIEIKDDHVHVRGYAELYPYRDESKKWEALKQEKVNEQ